ncbi:V-type ATP synthase subunit E family protein [Candidatus Uabimicrobium sp. HlEnr_7]|uniref:V-type ATP synthase subunit E family protein n=1 Tax=Candidatus Uabimicrobium helgolandensis TaxID=3095367 RepID=UPI003557AB68
MDIQELAKKLQQEGVDQGKEEAQKIIASAQEQAAKIHKEAEEEKQATVAKAQQEADKLLESGKQNLQLAARDVTLQLKKDVEQIFNNLLNKQVKENLAKTDVVKDLLQNLISQYTQNSGHSMTVEVPQKLSSDLEAWLTSEVKATCKKNDNIAGFLVHDPDGGCIEVTNDSVQDALSPHLSDMVKGILTQEK